MGKTSPAWLSDETWGQRAEEVLSLLPEHHRPWVAGLLSLQVGRGGDLWGELSSTFRNVEHDRGRCTLKLVSQVASPAWQLLHHVVGHHDEADSSLVDLKTLMIEDLQHTPPGKGRGRGRKTEDRSAMRGDGTKFSNSGAALYAQADRKLFFDAA